MDLNPAAVEAAAKVMHGACSIPGCNEWQGIYLGLARLALTAAAPFIVRATADAIADQIEAETESDAVILAPHPARRGGNLMNRFTNEPMTTMENRLYLDGVIRGKQRASIIARSHGSRVLAEEKTEVAGAEPVKLSCDETIWDGPYKMRCSYMIVGGACIRHGKNGKQS